MNTRRMIPMLVLLALLTPAVSQAQVFWRVSIKVFTDASGNRPAGCTDQEILDNFAYYNRLLTGYGRGARFVVTEIVQLPSSLSSWYNVAARNSQNRSDLQSAAEGDPSTYRYRSDAINLYVNNSSSGICCGGANGLLFVGNDAVGGTRTTMMHEIGHYLGLCHTQGCGCNGCPPDALGACSVPGDDNISDTLLDLPCWSLNEVAQNNYGVVFNSLTAGQKDRVNDVWLNVMSYHSGLNRLTPGQMDAVATTSNNSRDNVTGNYFFFVDAISGSDSIFRSGKTVGSSFQTVDGAIVRSDNDDVLLLRSGTYNKVTTGVWRISANRVLCSRNGTVRLTKTSN